MCQQKRRLHYDQVRKFKVSAKYNIDSQDKHQYPTNFITTSRYTLINFIPKSLFLQFQRYANIYFLFIAIITSIPSISPLDPFSAIAPLVIVLGVSMGREGYEDHKRHKSDKVLNSNTTTRIQDNQEKTITWKDILVGDIIKIHNNEPFPADLLVLSSEFENGNCYIETGALDGEKNMKPKQAYKQTQQLFKKGADFDSINLDVQAEVPSLDLYSFEGSFFLQKGQKAEKEDILCNSKQLLLRGAFLRNTDYIYGVVIYTGLDTKIMKNAEPGKAKQSDVEHKMNTYILGILITQFICSILMSILSQVWIDQHWETDSYLQYDKDDVTGLYGFKNFFTYFILCNTMIPISLIVSMEIVKVCQSYFIFVDDDMYVVEKDRRPNVLTSTINEELGQVEYIFSDKTGTLTCNVMEYKIGVIGNQQYGQLTEPEQDQTPVQKPRLNSQNTINQNKTAQKPKEEEFSLTKFTFKDDALMALLNQKKNNQPVDYLIKSDDGKSQFQISTQFDLVYEYFLLLSAAHECIIQKNSHNQNNDLSLIQYGGPSPDEITLVDAAKNIGFTFMGSSSNSMSINALGKDIQLDFLQIFEFDSDRKRMSVIVRDKASNIIKMYSKGADSIIKERLAQNQQNQDIIDQKLTEFSILGLRTLLMTVKVISEEEYANWEKRYNNLAKEESRDVKMREMQNEIEQNLTLIGASAVEDKLQNKVPETIFDLMRANIKVWVLTGDKLETAENIAKSCKLIQDDMQKLYLTQENSKDLQQYLDGECKQLFDQAVKHKQRKALLIQGSTLTVLFKEQHLIDKFVQFSKDCESVVCCRVNPKQKALVVRTIKQKLQKITLAIGDGANDVNMIQEAHIGCGIYGNEGMRAAQQSDFAFGEFQCLWRLLLVHGRYSYIRNTELILYFFYKNMLFTVPHLYFAFANAYTGQTIYDDWYILFFNMIFTALPVVIRAIFDQDVNYKMSDNTGQQTNDQIQKNRLKEKYSKHKFPELYGIGQQKTLFTLNIFLYWCIQGITHAIVIFVVTLVSLQNCILDETGHNSDLWTFSIIMFNCVFFVATMKLVTYTRYWTIFNYIAVGITSVLIYIICLLLSEVHDFSNDNLKYTPFKVLGSMHFYMILFLTTGIIFIIDYLIFSIERIITHFGKSDILRVFMRKNNQNKTKNDIIKEFYKIQQGEDFLKSFVSIPEDSQRVHLTDNKDTKSNNGNNNNINNHIENNSNNIVKTNNNNNVQQTSNSTQSHQKNNSNNKNNEQDQYQTEKKTEFQHQNYIINDQNQNNNNSNEQAQSMQNNNNPEIPAQSQNQKIKSNSQIPKQSQEIHINQDKNNRKQSNLVNNVISINNNNNNTNEYNNNNNNQAEENTNQ